MFVKKDNYNNIIFNDTFAQITRYTPYKTFTTALE